MIKKYSHSRRVHKASNVFSLYVDQNKHVIIKPVYSMDQLMARLTLAAIILYIIAYGYFISGGFAFGYPSCQYALILIPIWLVDGFKGLIEIFIPANYEISTEDLSKVTVIVPTKNGGSGLGRTLHSLTARFAPDRIIVVSNGSTDDTVAVVRGFGVICVDTSEALGKVRAINRALNLVSTPYVLLIDDDTIIGDAHIPTGLLDEGYEAVAFRVLVNISTWVTKLQMYEYRKSADIGKRFHNRKATVPSISGAIGLFKTAEIRRQSIHHTFEFAGEDLQRTLLIHLRNRNHGVVLTNSTVYTDPPTTLKHLFNQRTLGWFPGTYINFKNYVRLLFLKDVSSSLRYDAFYNSVLVMILDILRLFSLPILILFPWYFVLMYVTYVILETISYIKCGRKDPYWVVLLYPLYGLFGFVTRICAFCVFLYRRLSSWLEHNVYLDDYKTASPAVKFLAATIAILTSQALPLFYIICKYKF